MKNRFCIAVGIIAGVLLSLGISPAAQAQAPDTVKKEAVVAKRQAARLKGN